MNCEETQQLLPKSVLEDKAVRESSTNRRNNHESNGLTLKIGITLVFACFALIVARSYVSSSNGLKFTELRLHPSHVGSSNAEAFNTDAFGMNLDNEHGGDNKIYCDEQGLGECINRVLGICTEHGPCVAVPHTEPTGTPTSSPSNIYIEDNCDPHNPPCAEWFLGFCTKYYHCHEVKEPCGDNADDDDAAHTRKGQCDPQNPPCAPGETFMGICWKYQECDEEVPSNNITLGSDDKGGDETLTNKDDDSDKHNSTVAESKVDKSDYKNKTFSETASDDSPPVTGPKEKDLENNNVTSPASDKSDDNDEAITKTEVDEPGRNHTFKENEPQIDTSKDSNGTKPEESGDGHVGAEELDGDDFFDFKWMSLNITIPFLGELTSAPTMEPTQIHACDPLNPPCAKYEVGVCVEYQTCFGIHSTPHNTTQEQFNDDEGFTFEPTHMPVPDPTFRPSEFPTSTPTTTMPTPAGYTFEPTLTMMPTAAETSHPTRFLYCDPQNPPCDNYFFGVCLGVRYCFGTHEPTPSPTESVRARNDTEFGDE